MVTISLSSSPPVVFPFVMERGLQLGPLVIVIVILVFIPSMVAICSIDLRTLLAKFGIESLLVTAHLSAASYGLFLDFRCIPRQEAALLSLYSFFVFSLIELSTK